MTWLTTGRRTVRLTRPVTNMVAIGSNEPQRFDLSRRPWIPDGRLRREFPGKVRAMIRGRAVCMPK